MEQIFFFGRFIFNSILIPLVDIPKQLLCIQVSPKDPSSCQIWDHNSIWERRDNRFEDTFHWKSQTGLYLVQGWQTPQGIPVQTGGQLWSRHVLDYQYTGYIIGYVSGRWTFVQLSNCFVYPDIPNNPRRIRAPEKQFTDRLHFLRWKSNVVVWEHIEPYYPLRATQERL